jgi:hypothetical protein
MSQLFDVEVKTISSVNTETLKEQERKQFNKVDTFT